MTKASDNVFAKLIGSEGAAPATPASATAILYVKADGLWYSKDDAGTETLVSGGAGGGSVATDTIWDAAGDLAIGTGADTASRLAIGTAGQVLTVNAGATAPEWATAGGGSAELDYVEVTSPVSITQTAEASADTLVTGTSQAYAAVATMFEFFCPNIDPQDTALAFVTIYLYDGASSIGQWGYVRQQTNASFFTPVTLRHRMTPTATTHQYSVRATTNTGTATATCGAGGSGNYMPMFLRITTA